MRDCSPRSAVWLVVALAARRVGSIVQVGASRSTLARTRIQVLVPEED